MQDNVDGHQRAACLTGRGTLVLSGTNTYMGGTTVDAGTLLVDNSYSLASGSSLIVGQGASVLFGPALAVSAAAGEAASVASGARARHIFCSWRLGLFVEQVIALVGSIAAENRELFKGQVHADYQEQSRSEQSSTIATHRPENSVWNGWSPRRLLSVDVPDLAQ